MQMDNNNFNYSYSAKEQAEINRIRGKYEPREETGLDKLRRLDASVTKPGMTVSIIMGVLGSLILGTGMCCCMLWQDTLFIPGILIGLVGIGTVVAAYPVYSAITKRRRKKLAPEILRLTEELRK